MKSLDEQIKYIDTILLKLYGVENIVDYVSEVTINSVDITKINAEIENICKYFPVKRFNFGKKDKIIQSFDQASQARFHIYHMKTAQTKEKNTAYIAGK